jgi:hypothetical protein
MNASKARLLQYGKYKGYSARKLAALLDLSKSYFIGEGGISSDILEKVNIKFPELNLYWVIAEEGEMIKQEYPPQEHSSMQPASVADPLDILNLQLPVEETLIMLRDRIIHQAKEIRVLKQIIEKQNDIIAQAKK